MSSKTGFKHVLGLIYVFPKLPLMILLNLLPMIGKFLKKLKSCQ